MAGGAGRAGGTERASAAWKTGGPAQRPAESIPSADDSRKSSGSPQTARRCPTPPPSSGTPCWTFCGLGSRLHFRHFGPTTGRPSSPGIPPLSIAAISIQSFSLWSMSSARKTGSPFRNPCARRICWKKRILLTNSVDDFLTLACQLCEEVMEVRPGQPAHALPQSKARAYIDRHYMDPELSLSSVANAVSVSPNHLSTLFKSKIGVGFSEYLTEVRIRQAKRLLITSDLRVSEVGERVGYQNMEYFSMLFKKNTGQTPSQYRRPTRYETDESCSRRPEKPALGRRGSIRSKIPGGVYGHPGGDVEYQPAGYRPVPPLFLGRIPYPGGAGHFRKQADPHCPG